MTKCTEISYKAGEMNQELSAFLGELLEKQIVSGVMVPVKQKQGGVMQALVTDSAGLQDVDPFAPVMPINSAKLASSLTATPSGRPVALVMRSCESRAMVELSKLKQAHYEDVLLVSIDCLGRYENADFKKFIQGNGTTEEFIANNSAGKESGGAQITNACKICEFPADAGADLQLGIIGAGSGKVIIEAVTEKGEAALEQAGRPTTETPSGREGAINSLASERAAARDALFASYRETDSTFEALDDRLADCVNCYNCRVACPVCYCKECVFVTDTFRHKGEQFFNWANSAGSLKMPTDTNFYHLTRMSHVATTCVGCGQCTSACPNDIDLMPVFRTAAERAQKRFDYQAGRSRDEAQPLAVFESDELVEVTGQVK